MAVRRLKVIEIADETQLIRRIVLAAEDGCALPGFTAGAHIAVHAPGVGPRKYSLVETADFAAPKTCTLCIRREDGGQGGSRWMHALKLGDVVETEAPENNFALAAGSGRVTLVAGGIGITPLLSMAAELKAQGRPFRLIYAARAREEFAFLPDLRKIAGDALNLHADEEAGKVLAIDALLDSCASDEQLYICGPRPMIAAASDGAKARGWGPGRLHCELFFSAAAEPSAAHSGGDTAFEVELASTGRVVQVPADKTILDALIEAGVDPLHDCDRGECGVCQVGVIEGAPDHRDHLLNEAEREAGKLIQICVSRAKSSRLKLDL